MISREEFLSRCDSVIPQEEKELYKSKTKKMWITLVFVLFIELILTIVTGFYSMGFAGFMVIVMLVSLIIIVSTMKYRWKDFKKKYSHFAFDCLLKGYKYKFEPDCCISRTVFDSSSFGGNYDSYSGEDLLSINIPNDNGSTSDTVLRISDLYVTRTETRTVTVRNRDGSTSTRTETYTVTVYKGAFGYINFPFKFKCNLSLNINVIGDRIKLEDIKFNKTFKTYTDNQLEALIILTPTLMNKLIGFSNRLSGFKLSLRKKGTLYFGMSKNLFKLNTFGLKPCGKVFERYYDDLTDLILMIEEIKTNNKVFDM